LSQSLGRTLPTLAEVSAGASGVTSGLASGVTSGVAVAGPNSGSGLEQHIPSLSDLRGRGDLQRQVDLQFDSLDPWRQPVE